jgi:hypothetical protein
MSRFHFSSGPPLGGQWASYQAILNYPGTAVDTMPGFETVDADEAIAAVEQRRALPRIPVAVISKTEPFAVSPTVPEALRTQLEKVWPEVQERLVDLGPQAPHIFATGSDHYVQIRDPDLVVSIIPRAHDSPPPSEFRNPSSRFARSALLLRSIAVLFNRALFAYRRAWSVGRQSLSGAPPESTVRDGQGAFRNWAQHTAENNSFSLVPSEMSSHPAWDGTTLADGFQPCPGSASLGKARPNRSEIRHIGGSAWE